MKLSLIQILTVTAMISPAAVSAAELDLQKVYDVLQAPFNGGTKADLLQIQDGKIVAGYASGVGGLNAEEEAAGHETLEDCRQVAVRQAVLDATLAGEQITELSRKHSHRVAYAQGIDDGVEAFVALKVLDAAGKEQKRTFTYKLSDAGSCAIVEMLPVVNENVKKDVVEARLVSDVIPNFSEAERQARKTEEEVTTDAELADKMVTKMFKYECEQVSINKAIQLSAIAFKNKYASNPILFMDWEQSRVKNGEDDPNGTGSKKDLSGFWIVRMVDASGTQSMKTQLDFNLVEDAAEECTGSMSAITELN